MTQSPGDENKDPAAQPADPIVESQQSEAAQTKTEAPEPATSANQEPAADEVATEAEPDLAQALEAAQAKADENWERYLRATAEQDNIRKRSAREVEQARRFAVERFAKDLLAVVDSLDLGLKAVDEAANDEAAADKALLEGVRLTRKMFGETLARHGISEMEPKGQVFDPERHEAMSAVPTAEAAPNTVIDVVQKGYLLNERVLRPAMVVVAQAPAA